MPRLRVRGAAVRFGAVQALRGVDLDVPDGSFVGLMGPTGAGKSTLLHSIAGLRPASGRFEFDGRDLAGLPAHARVRAGIHLVPERAAVFPGLSVVENLRVAMADRDVDEMLERFPVLQPLAARRAATLSGGEQRAVALARAVGMRPQLLMVDEFSLGLAPMLAQSLLDRLAAIRQEHGLTMLVVDKHAEQLAALADFLYIMRRGQVAWAGEARELGRETAIAAQLGTPAPD